MSAGRGRGLSIWLSLALISATGAVASYLQALIVVIAADGSGTVSYFVAGLADPTIFAASANLYDAHKRRARLPRWSMVSFVVALAVTAYFNVAAGSPHAVPSWLVRVWPPVAFLMALESLMSYVRRGRDGNPGEGAVPVTATGGQSPREWLDEQLRAMLRHESDRTVAEAFGVSRTRVASAADRGAGKSATARAALNGSGPDAG